MLLACLDAREASIVASCVEAFAASCASIVARFWGPSHLAPRTPSRAESRPRLGLNAWRWCP